MLELAREHDSWGITQALPEQLDEAFEFFYPDGHLDGFRPDVVDFFSTLSTYVDIGEGLPGAGLRGARELYNQLKFAICHLLIEKTREIDEGLRSGHPYLEQMMAPDNIVITSNWDFVLERYAELHDVPIRHSGASEGECVILKLHGSIDWISLLDRVRDRNGNNKYLDDDYCTLDERLYGPRPYTKTLPSIEDPEDSDPTGQDAPLIRIRAVEQINTAWRQIKSRANNLYMVTMGTGKASRIGPLEGIWTDAYNAISRAEEFEIIGYSMPPDDVEIRTLLRAGVERGRGDPRITVRNPAPDVHIRIRSLLDRELGSEYRPVDGLRP